MHPRPNASPSQLKIANAKTFMIGCGALGCEYLKNFAMLGLGTGPNGKITTTDNDRIEVKEGFNDLLHWARAQWFPMR